MAYSMAWFKAQEEKKKQEEIAKRKAADPNYVPPTEEKKTETVTNAGSYFKLHRNTNANVNKHYFLAEELNIPRANCSNTQRLNMFSNHINQCVHLKTPEYPKVFTNFEDQVGEYSVAYKKAEETFEVIQKIVKNEYNYDLIVRYKRSRKYDILHYNHAKNITEDYGLALNDCLPDVQPGDIVSKDSFIYKSDNYDEDGNFMLGVNLNAVYMPWKNLTYEDKLRA